MNYQDYVDTAINFLMSESLIQTLMYIAIPSTIIFILLIILTMFGFDSDIDDIDVDDPGDGIEGHPTSLLSSISFKNAVYFLMFFSWTAITLINFGMNQLLALNISVVASILFVILLNLTLTFLLKLQEDNTTKIKDAIDLYGEVYLTIHKNKTGKVELVLNGAKRIYDARSDKGTIKTGTKVKIIDTDEDTGTLIVTTKL
jgi:membrane protein implicated in regulation of membrane protease activity